MGCLTGMGSAAEKAEEEGFISLFDGKTLKGWKIAENQDSFQVRDGMIVVHGPRAHLFYDGEVENHDFKNFVFKADVMTFPNANSGIYFHTRFQPEGWPDCGYEAQVNNSHRDPKRTGSLYNVRNVLKAPAKDGEWFTEEIIVRGNQITIKVDGKTLVDYTEVPDDVKGNRKLSSGTFALQAHDPESKVYYKNIRVKPLPE
jgi:hypothetical protein